MTWDCEQQQPQQQWQKALSSGFFQFIRLPSDKESRLPDAAAAHNTDLLFPAIRAEGGKERGRLGTLRCLFPHRPNEALMISSASSALVTSLVVPLLIGLERKWKL